MTGTVVLSELMVSRAGSIDPAKFPEERFDLYSIPSFDRGSADIVAGAEIGSSKQIIRTNDVLLSKIVPHIRRSWIVGPSRGKRLIASGEWIVFRSERADPAYLRHVLTGDPFHSQFMATVSGIGGSLLRARPAFVGQIQVPLPSIEEQRRIAAILDRADALRAKRREAVGHLDELRRSVFLDMFGSACREWPMTDVGSLVDPARGGIRTGPFGSQLLTSEFTEDGVAVLGIDNAVQNKFTWSERRFISVEKYEKLKRYTVNAGDVLITIMGTCGRAAVVPPEIPLSINTKHLCCITLDQKRCTPQYLHAYFLGHPVARDYLSRTAKGAIMSGLNMGIIKDLPVILPPLSLQGKFGERLSGVDKTLRESQSGLDALDALFASLQQRAFSGQL